MIRGENGGRSRLSQIEIAAADERGGRNVVRVGNQTNRIRQRRRLRNRTRTRRKRVTLLNDFLTDLVENAFDVQPVRGARFEIGATFQFVGQFLRSIFVNDARIAFADRI